MSGNAKFGGTVELSGITLDGNTITGVDDSGEFTNDDAHIMTSAGVEDKILGYSYLTTSGTAADSTLAGGLAIGTGRNNSANQIVRTQGNGYAEFGWINTTSGNTTSTITDVYVNTNDGYIRKATNAEFKSQLGILSTQITAGTQTIAGAKTFSSTLTVSGTDTRIYLSGANTDINMDASANGQLHLDGNGYGFGIAVGSSHVALYHNSTARNLVLGTNETARLTIAGDSGNTTCTGTLTGTGLFAGSAGKIGADSTDYISFTNNTRADIYINNSNEFRFESDGDFHADGDVIASSTTISDSRLKDNIITIGGALDTIKSLRGVSYTWNAGKKKGEQDIGLIAQEVEEIIPEIVKDKKMPLMDGIDPNETYKTIDYEKIIAVLVEAVKDQQTQIDELKRKIK
jgi:hypothetical protein